MVRKAKPRTEAARKNAAPRATTAAAAAATIAATAATAEDAAEATTRITATATAETDSTAAAARTLAPRRADTATTAAAARTLATRRADATTSRFTFYNQFIANYDSQNTMNVTRFVRERCSESDFCVCKMDIEGGEWNLLPILEDNGTLDLFAELFVEIHFKHPSYRMSNTAHWDIHKKYTKEQARALLERYRSIGLYAHYWP